MPSSDAHTPMEETFETSVCRIEGGSDHKNRLMERQFLPLPILHARSWDSSGQDLWQHKEEWSEMGCVEWHVVGVSLCLRCFRCEGLAELFRYQIFSWKTTTSYADGLA